jgi:hypothetical protein
MINKATFSPIGWVAGGLSALVWGTFGVLLVPATDYFVGWVSYCIFLNLSTALWIQHQSGKNFSRFGWILNCTVLGGVILGTGGGFFNSAQATDFGGVALMSGLTSFGLLGSAFGTLLGWASYLPNPPKLDFIHTLLYNVLRGTTMGVGLTAVFITCVLSLYWLILAPIAIDDLADFVFALVSVSMFAPFGGIPGFGVSILTTVLTHLSNWWRSRIKPSRL